MRSTVEDVIRDKLTASLAPTRLAIENESHLHHGHASSPQTGDSHFRLEIVSDRFEGLNRVDRQRLVYQALAQELAGPVHALALATRTPSEDRRTAPTAGQAGNGPPQNLWLTKNNTTLHCDIRRFK